MEDNADNNVMMPPPPETPVLKVTAPPSQKDPKKVAAGRAGAAARKAKQAHLLEELRKAKESMRNKDYGAPPDREVEDFVAPPRREEDEKAAPALRTARFTNTWIIGVVAAGLGLAYWAASQRAPVDPPVPPKKSSMPPVDGPSRQLKVEPNPFYME